MKATVFIPKGWYVLRTNTSLKPGDRMLTTVVPSEEFYDAELHGGRYLRWVPAYVEGCVAQPDEVQIRKIN